MTDQRAFVVEHLDPELGQWSTLEYACIARESHALGARFLLSSVPAELSGNLPAELVATEGFEVEQRSVEEIYPKDKVCLLDPAAQVELSPEDGDNFDVFLFGGILGRILHRGA
jgi:ribosome biogenesis SPOUT family RNA methylase Rps3